MKSIIETIYFHTLESKEVEFQKQHATDKEYAAYKAIRSELTDEQKVLFDNFEELYAERHCDSEEEMYFLGFRMGAQMAFEMMNADFRLKLP